MDKRLTGAWGEAEAARFLRKKGYKLLGMNYRTRMGEVDIIAQKGGFLAFVEVKTRSGAAHGEAKEFVTARKQARVILAAQDWLGKNETELQPRFDVVEVYKRADGSAEVNHIENAFEQTAAF